MGGVFSEFVCNFDEWAYDKLYSPVEAKVEKVKLIQIYSEAISEITRPTKKDDTCSRAQYNFADISKIYKFFWWWAIGGLIIKYLYIYIIIHSYNLNLLRFRFEFNFRKKFQIIDSIIEASIQLCNKWKIWKNIINIFYLKL